MTANWAPPRIIILGICLSFFWGSIPKFLFLFSLLFWWNMQFRNFLGKWYIGGKYFENLHNWLEKAMATHSSILAWRIPWTGEPGGLLSMGLHRVRHDWSHLACVYWRRQWQPTPVFLPGESQGQRSLPSVGSHRVGHDWCDLAAAA